MQTLHIKKHNFVAWTDEKWCSLKDQNTFYSEVTVLSEWEKSKLVWVCLYILQENLFSIFD